MNSSIAYAKTKGKPYAETFRCKAGDVCLDFCNSGQGIRGPRRSEWLTSYEDLMEWLVAAGLMPEAQASRLRNLGAKTPDLAVHVWQRAINLREALFQVFSNAAKGGTVARRNLELIEFEHAATLSLERLAKSGEYYVWSLQPASNSLLAALEPIVQTALRLLTSDRLARVRRCGSSTCFWLFVDETKNHSKRWCEMAICGNLAKVRRHRAKTRLRDNHSSRAKPTQKGDQRTS